MKFNLPNDVLYILNKLNMNGSEGYIVGGAVRDLLLNIEPIDYDFATNLKNDEIIDRFKDEVIINNYNKFGTVCLIINNHKYEITTYRIDGKYKDNRHPNEVLYTDDIYKDLLRRDFTINAIYYNQDKGLVYKGSSLDDINNKVLKCNGNPSDRFNEDALRMLRAIRLASIYNLKIEKETSDAINKCAYLLENISKERIRDELEKFFVQGNNIYDYLIKYKEVFLNIFSELKMCDGFNQNNPWHNLDVLNHLFKTVHNIKSKSDRFILCIAALFHDVGKPLVYSIDDKGIYHFKNHADSSINLLNNIKNEILLSNKELEQLKVLIKYHDDKIDADKISVKKALNKMGLDNMKLILELKKADNLAHDLNGIHKKDIEKTLDILNKVPKIIDEIIENKEAYTIQDLKISGSDLVNLNIYGKKIGEVLNYLLNLVIIDNSLNNKNKLLNIVECNKSNI